MKQSPPKPSQDKDPGISIKEGNWISIVAEILLCIAVVALAIVIAIKM